MKEKRERDDEREKCAEKRHTYSGTLLLCERGRAKQVG